MTVVVYDLGGGTFDVTVMQIRDRQFKTLVTDGDVRLGGRDWDRRIVDHAAARFMAEHPGDDPRDDPASLQALLQQAEEAKRTLSERAKTRLVCTHQGRRAAIELTRAEFDELTADLLERTRVTTKLVLNEAGLTWSEVDKLLLSGGSTRMPQVERMLRDLSGQVPDRSISPDEAVAHGAALYHGLLRTTGDDRPGAEAMAMKVVNVNAHSLGLVTRSSSSRSALHLDPDPAEHAAAALRQPGLPDRPDRPAADPDPDRGRRRARSRGLHPARRVLHRAAPPRAPGRLAHSPPLHLRPERTDQGPGGCRPPNPAEGGHDRPAGLDGRPEESRTGP